MRDLFYTGLGLASILKEQIEKKHQEISKIEEIGKDKVESLLKTAEEKGKSEKDKLREEIREMIKETIVELNLATKDDVKKS